MDEYILHEECYKSIGGVRRQKPYLLEGRGGQVC